jgi:predicted ester cyclase
MTDIERNKRLAVRWLELVSAGDIEEMRRMTSPTWTMEGGPPNLPAGHEGLRVLFDDIGEIEQTWTIDDVIAEGDKVVVRATNHCTQESFFGVPGRGIEQVFTATFTFQILEGLVARTWRNAADLQRLLQLGARILPAAGEPA